ncbi:MAG: hypothetical protein IIT56_06860 [Bacteroidales bacterium]|nr:hypothetical protein [Bacteroidales bacterium]
MNVAAKIDEIAKIVMTLKNNDIATCIFIDPETEQVKVRRRSVQTSWSSAPQGTPRHATSAASRK